MKTKSVKLVLTGPGDKVLAERELVPGGEAILIGRSRSCSLQVGDASVSSRHAKIYWKGGALRLEDVGSHNGVFADGKRIEKAVRVEKDCFYAIGGCRLKFEFDEPRSRRGKPTLERVAGAKGGRKIETIASAHMDENGNAVYRIGLNPTNELKLNDPLVSRQHATIRLNPAGECWIEDEGSVNGTYVNKEKLNARKPRLLKTGDRISIAYFEFLYRDGTATPPPSITPVLIAILALGLAFGAYKLLPQLLPVPDAASYREKAEIAASKEDFEEALARCDQADDAKNGSLADQQDLTAKLRAKVNVWKSTYDSFHRLRDYLSRGSVESARQLIDNVRSVDFAFTWDTPETGDDARKVRDEFDFAARLIGVCVDADVVIRKVSSEGANLEELRDVKGRIEAELKASAAELEKTSYLQPLKKRLEQRKNSICLILDGVEGVNRVLDSIAVSREGAFSFRTVVAELEKVETNAELPTTVRAYARSLLPVGRLFVKTEDFLDQEKVGIVDLNLAEVRKGEHEIPLPAKDDCARHAKLSDARAEFLKIHGFYQKTASNLRPMIKGLADSGIRDGEKGGLVTRTLDPAVWEKVLSFDCFSRDYPKPSRVDPTSVYDEIVGIEYGYNLMRDLPKPPGRMMESLMHFTPKCQSVKQAVERARAFANYLDREENAVFRSGKLGNLLTLVKSVVLDRDALVVFLKQQAKTAGGAPMGRKELVAGLFAEYFADEPTYGMLRKLENGFRTILKSINELNEEYERLSDPEKRIALRPQFLEKGVPGMPVVRMIWGEMQPE